MLAALAVAASLLVAQPFGLMLEAVDSAGHVTTFTDGSRYPTREACETALKVKADHLREGGNVILLQDGSVYTAVGLACYVIGGVVS